MKLSRRGLLAGVDALVGTAGCQTQAAVESTPSPQRNVDWELSVLDPQTPAYDAAPRQEDSPQVTFDQDATLVVVFGTLWVGSSSCGVPVLETARYDDQAGTLDITVRAGEKSDVDVCTSDYASDAYRVVIAMDHLPDTVVATQHGLEYEHTTTVRP